MKYMKSYMRALIEVPVYVEMPDGFEDEDDVVGFLEDQHANMGDGWTFAIDDVVDAVRSGVPIAEDAETDWSSIPDTVVDECPHGALSYDLTEVYSADDVSRFALDTKVERMKDLLEDAAYSGDIKKVIQLTDMLRELLNTND